MLLDATEAGEVALRERRGVASTHSSIGCVTGPCDRSRRGDGIAGGAIVAGVAGDTGKVDVSGVAGVRGETGVADREGEIGRAGEEVVIEIAGVSTISTSSV